MNSKNGINGFTLLELLIAISIFSVMAAIAYGGIRIVIDGSHQIEAAANGLSSMQRAFLYLQQDLEQAVPRGVRDDFGSPEDAFVCCDEGKLLRLTRGGVRGVIKGGSDLRRVEYDLDEGRLERRVWSILDRVQESKSSRMLLMEDVQGVDIKVLGYEDSEWKSSFPLESASENAELPRAIEITITTGSYGAVSRLFVIGL